MSIYTDTIQPFCADYARWLMDGAPSGHKVFTSNVGLCSSLAGWIYNQQPGMLYEDALNKLQSLFTTQGLDVEYPFNNGSMVDYVQEMDSDQAPYNPMRREFAFIHGFGQSEALTTFYRTYDAWIKVGARDKRPFHCNGGLCYNTLIADIEGSYTELRAQLRSAFGSYLNPFNPTFEALCNEMRAGTCHLNEARIKWVRDHCFYTAENTDAP